MVPVPRLPLLIRCDAAVPLADVAAPVDDAADAGEPPDRLPKGSDWSQELLEPEEPI